MLAPTNRDLSLECLCAMRDARAAFFQDLTSHAKTHLAGDKKELKGDDVDLLTSNESYQIAEFYYLVKKFELSEPRKIRSFLLRHNDDMRAYKADKEKRDALGLSLSRLEECVFSDVQIEKVVHNISDGKLRLDQADIGRLLAPLMSPETTRKALVTLARGGLLLRINVGHVWIVSTGALEEYFEKHLQAIVGALVPTTS